MVLVTHYDEKYHKPLMNDFNFRIVNLGPSIGSNRKSGIYGRLQFVLMRIAGILFEYPNIKLMWMVERVLRAMSERFDLIISVAAPHSIHWGVGKAIRKKSDLAKVWIADCGDPFMGNNMDTFKKPFYFKYLEKSFCRNATYLTVPTANSIDGYYSEFHDKIHVIPQGFNFQDISDSLLPYKRNDIPTFAYAGNFIEGKRDPRPILEFLSTLDQDFRFYIFTKNLHLVNAYQSVLGEKLIISNFIDRSELIGRLSKMDFLVNLDNNSSIATPSKLIDYHLIGRPIASLNSTNLDQKLLLEFLSGNYNRRLVVENIDQFDITIVTEKFLALADITIKE